MSEPAYDPASVDFEVFALFIEARRIARRKTTKQLAHEAKVDLDALQRAVQARNPGAITFFALCDWIGEPPTLFLKRELRHA